MKRPADSQHDKWRGSLGIRFDSSESAQLGGGFGLPPPQPPQVDRQDDEKSHVTEDQIRLCVGWSVRLEEHISEAE